MKIIYYKKKAKNNFLVLKIFFNFKNKIYSLNPNSFTIFSS
jgi:hypothetical protein